MARGIRRRILAGAAVLAALLFAGCSGRLAEAVADFNARATQVAGGQIEIGDGTTVPLVPTGGVDINLGGTPQASGEFDLVANPSITLVSAWEQIYALPAGTPFSINATQDQVGMYVVEYLQAAGWGETARGGSAAIANGQVRVDLAVEATDGNFGAGTVTFQPTLDGTARVRLNPQGGDFHSLQMPNNFTSSIGDALIAAVSGSPATDVQQVTLNRLVLEGGTMQVSGTAN